MATKVIKEWTLNMSWGNLALISWGQETKPPVLLVHGYMDSAATFIPLLDELPDDFFYVAFDMPGHGKSDPYQPGLIMSQLHIVEVIHRVVENLKLRDFIYIAHSMGAVIGAFYNFLYPGNIKKIIMLDPLPPITMFYFVHHQPKFWYQFLHDEYYANMNKYNSKDTKRYTLDQAINLLVRNRSLTEDQAEIILSRSLLPISGTDDLYRLSWDQRMKKITTVPVSEETLFTVMSTNLPPTLAIIASETTSGGPSKKFASIMLERCHLMVPHFYLLTVQGNHDMHITNSSAVAIHVLEFMNKHFDSVNVEFKSKL